MESLLPTTSAIPYSSWTEDDKVLYFEDFDSAAVIDSAKLHTILLQVLIMQDLHSEGWRDAINKKKGLDIHHLRKAFKVHVKRIYM